MNFFSSAPCLLSLILVGITSLLVACGEADEGDQQHSQTRPQQDSLATAGRAVRSTRVVLITLDTMRFDTFERENQRMGSMPFTREWARKGIILDRHYSATSTTQPTHASLLTGLHPWQHGVSRNGQTLGEQHTTLAEIFARAGYRTGAVIASFPLHKSFGFDQGFEHYDDSLNVPSAVEWEGRTVPDGAFFSLGDSITAKAIELIDGFGEADQFLWFHYFDLHQPYGDAAGRGGVVKLGEIHAQIERGSPTVSALVERARKGYEADARVLDRLLDQLIGRLYRDADRVDTHLIVVSDHGESFGESESLGHGKRLTDELIHVPCFLISPGVAPGRVHVPVGSIDVPVTLLSLAGLSGIAGSGLDVTKALPEDRSAFGMRRTFVEPFAELRLDGLRHVLEDFVFFRATSEGVTTGNANRIMRNSDPRIDEEDTNVRALFGAFERELAGAGAATQLDDEAKAALKALGYVQ